jgi:ABC-type uncharacterized transport system substrate-binding protein
MKRREFITLLGVTAAWPLAAEAQQPGIPVVGYMAPYARNSDQSAANLVTFRLGLGDLGYVEGENVKIEYRFADGHYDRMPVLASDLVSRQVNVLVAVGGTGLAAKAATADIPIVTMAGGDPVKAGLVLRLNRPEANVTGVALFAYSLGAKRFELLREAIPRTKLVAVLVNSKNPDPETRSDTNEVEAAARAVGQRILVVEASSISEIHNAFAAMVEQGVDALLVMADPFLNSRRVQIIGLAIRHAIPAIYEWREHTLAGGLMSYGSNLSDAHRQVGAYTARILKGAKPADLPFARPLKIELIINLTTAKTLGLEIAPTLLARADEVIE